MAGSLAAVRGVRRPRQSNRLRDQLRLRPPCAEQDTTPPGNGLIEAGAMRRDLERRLRAVELKRSRGYGLWIRQGDGKVRRASGSLLTCEELEIRRRVSGKVAFVESETDARSDFPAVQNP